MSPKRYPSRLGSDLGRVPTSSIRIGDNDGEYMFSKKYKDHVLLICAFAPSHAIPRISNAVITFVNTMRARSDEVIVVLAIKADDIEAYSRNRAKNNNEEFDDKLMFVKGMPNTIRGLQSVDVCHARCICIIGCENKSKKIEADVAMVQAKQDSEEMNTDLYIVLAALELDAILSSYVRRLLREKRQAPLPVVIQEISTDATINFLPDFYSLSRKAKKLWEKHDKHVWESRRGIITEDVDIGYKNIEYGLNDSIKSTSDSPSTDVFVSSTPALCQGRVLTKHIIDSLTIKMFFSPHIIEFWQTVMGMQKSKPYLTQKERESMLGQGSFDKLEIPQAFQGTYQDLFETLLVTFGAVAIGLNRFPENGSSYVAIMPPPDALVSSRDQVFVILTHIDEVDCGGEDGSVKEQDIIINEDTVNDNDNGSSEVRESIIRDKTAAVSAFTS